MAYVVILGAMILALFCFSHIYDRTPPERAVLTTGGFAFGPLVSQPTLCEKALAPPRLLWRGFLVAPGGREGMPLGW